MAANGTLPPNDPPGERGHRALWGRICRFWWEHRWGWLAPLLVLALLLGYFRVQLYKHYLWNDDIPSYLFQADLFLHGRIKAPVPRPDDNRLSGGPEFFRTWMVVPHSFDDLDARGKHYEYMYSRYTPGHPLLLAAVHLLTGSYRPAPVILTLLAALLLYALLRAVADERAARWGLTLLCLSPFFLAYGASLLSHNSTFLFLAAGTLAYVHRWRASTPRRRALGAGAAAFAYTMALTCRPFTGACFIVAVVVWEFARLPRERTAAAAPWAAMLLAGAIPVAGLLAYNRALTGKAMRFPFTEYWPRDTLGFTGLTEFSTAGWSDDRKEENKRRFKGEETIGTAYRHYLQHTPFNSLRNLAIVLKEYNSQLLLLPGGLLLLLLLLLFFRGRLHGLQYFFAVQAGMVVVGQLFYFAEGQMAWGPRYYFETLLPVVALLAILLPAGWERAKAMRPLGRRAAVGLFLALAAAHFLGTFYPHWYWQRISTARRDLLWRNVRETVRPPAIVFLPPQRGAHGRYVGHFEAHLRNDPLFEETDPPIIYALDNGEANGLLTVYYPRRRIYEITSGYAVKEKRHEDYTEIPLLDRKSVPAAPAK